MASTELAPASNSINEVGLCGVTQSPNVPPSTDTISTEGGGELCGSELSARHLSEVKCAPVLVTAGGGDIGVQTDDSPTPYDERLLSSLRDNHCYPPTLSPEDVPLINGRGNSSQEESGSESWLLATGSSGGGERVLAGDGARSCLSLKAYSSASGDAGSSVWSEDDGRGSNEQDSPHYSLLDSGAESDLSSPGGTPVPVATLINRGKPLSLGNNQSHVTDTSVSSEQFATTEMTLIPQLASLLPESQLPPDPASLVMNKDFVLLEDKTGETVNTCKEGLSVCVQIDTRVLTSSEDGGHFVSGGQNAVGEREEEGHDVRDGEGEDGDVGGVTVEEEEGSERREEVGEGGVVSEGGEDVEGEENEGSTQGEPSVPFISTHSTQSIEEVLPTSTTTTTQTLTESRTTSLIMSDIDIEDPLLESNLDSSNLDSGVRRPPPPLSSSDLPVLQPLSPDPDLNEPVYEDLRRTLSHRSSTPADHETTPEVEEPVLDQSSSTPADHETTPEVDEPVLDQRSSTPADHETTPEVEDSERVTSQQEPLDEPSPALDLPNHKTPAECEVDSEGVILEQEPLEVQQLTLDFSNQSKPDEQTAVESELPLSSLAPLQDRPAQHETEEATSQQEPLDYNEPTVSSALDEPLQERGDESSTDPQQQESVLSQSPAPEPSTPPSVPLISTPSTQSIEEPPPLPTTTTTTQTLTESRSMMSDIDIEDPLLESNLDSSNLDSGVRRPPPLSSGDLPVLQPLSPDPDLNDQYEYLRRTLSHSQRRYSTRRRRPPRRNRDEDEDSSERGQRSGSDARAGQRGHGLRDMLHTHNDERDVETHVDVHGRTYFMDHSTRTVAFEQGRAPQPSDVSRGMEMLERRYLSLQRSFRSTRPNRFANSNLSTIPSSPSTPTNLSLSLTRAEAESLSQANTRTSHSQSRTSQSRRKSSRWRFWQRSLKTVPQSPRSESGGEDDILPVSPGWEGSPPPSVSESGEVVERERGEGARDVLGGRRDRRREERSESGGHTSSGSRSSDATLSGSVAGMSEEGEGESVLEEVEQQQPSLPASTESEEVVSGGGVIGDVVANGVVANGEVVSGREGEREGEGEGEEEGEPEGRRRDDVFAEQAAAPAAASRNHSIMRASGMAGTDHNAAVRARHRVRATTVRGHRRGRRSEAGRDTDDETNEGPRAAHVPTTSPTPEEPETTPHHDEVKEAPPLSPPTPSPLSEELLTSPALKFITRRDLYSFLSNAGEPGDMFLANRGLMELVQRIRTNNNLFAKYQHSRQLVVALNRFCDTKADLPQGWEKKLNREGKVFYIDHDNCVTSFIDPRLPLPDTQFTYTIPTTSSTSHHSHQQQELQFGEEVPIRAHHTTVMGGMRPSPSTGPSVTVTSPQPPQEMTYERQVVSFFRHPEVYQRISQRYSRGVRPQLREIIEDVRANGTPALERIQTSGSVAAYELALVLSLFEEDISAINSMIEPVQQQPQPAQDDSGAHSVSTLQRKKEAFSSKLQNFKVMMARLGFAQSSRLKFNIRRDHLLEDSYEHVMKSDVRHMQRKRLNICFRGEDGLDYGGPSREFFFLLSREIFNPYYGLFEYSASDTYTVQISPTSMFIQNNMDWFRFAGRVIGLVIVQGFLLDVFFTRTIYKALTNRPPSLKDLESLEPAFYSSLVWILENDPEPLDLTFTVEEEAFGKLTTHELNEGGMDIPVTDDNKEEYIQLMLKWRLDRGIGAQMNMIKKGFSEVMPVSLLQGFDASELEFLTAGTLEIDVEDWKKHTEYRNGYHATHPVILYFWQAVEMFDNEQRLRLLQFVTGTSSVPFEGFRALRGSNGPKRFTVDFFSDVNSLPRTHTCFNRIDLPPYPSYDILYHKLLIAIEEGNTFGIE